MNQALTTLKLTPGLGPASGTLSWLHTSVFWIAIAICFLVFISIVVLTFQHQNKTSLKEWAWLAVPTAMFVGLVYPACSVMLNANPPPASAYLIQLTYHHKTPPSLTYPIIGTVTTHSDLRANAAIPLVVPVHRPIWIQWHTPTDLSLTHHLPHLIQSRGLLHTLSFTVNTPGTYQGVCAGACGIHHHRNVFLIRALTPDALHQWQAQHPPTAST